MKGHQFQSSAHNELKTLNKINLNYHLHNTHFVFCKMKLDIKKVIMIYLFIMTYIPPHSINATSINTHVPKMRHKRNANVPPSLSISTTMPISSNKTESPKTLSHHLSTAAESGITFISILLFGAVIIISVYSWKKFADSSWRYITNTQFISISSDNYSILIYVTL